MKLRQIIETAVERKLTTRRITEESDKYTDIYNQIDWDNVASEILKTFKIKTRLSFKQKGKYVEMISDDVIKQCGIFQYAIGSCHISFFSNGLLPDHAENMFWASISLTYPGNGLNIGTLWVGRDNKITIRKETPRKIH